MEEQNNYEKYVEEIISTFEMLKDKKYEQQIQHISEKIVEIYKNKGLVIVCGNGGSAADAQHFVAEHVGAYLDRNRRPFPAISLTTNTSNITAITNDYNYDDVFLRQLQAYDDFKYVLIGISTSGNSNNVNKAIEHAKSKGNFTVGFTGKDGGKMQQISDLCVTVPHTLQTPIVQTAHNAIYHKICEIVEKKMTE